jgi:DNA-binding LacI/PurR family transcriptional regulator
MPVGHHFYSNVISGVHEELVQHDYAMMLSDFTSDYTSPGKDGDFSNLKALVARRVDGLIFRPTLDNATDLHFEELRKRNIPFVTVDRRLLAANCDFVGTDDYDGGASAARHLLNLGHRHLGHLAGPALVSTARQRRRGFEDTIQNAGAKCTVIEMPDFADEAHVRKMLMLSDRPSAVFCVNDPTAFILFKFARELGLSIPQDLSVIGFADLPESQYVNPALTTMRQDPQTIGRRAARLLLSRINEKREPEAFEAIQLTPTLVVRDSTTQFLTIRKTRRS